MTKTKKYIFYKVIALCIALPVSLAVLALVYANWKIPYDTKNFVYDNVSDIPIQKTALVLGTSNKLRNGDDNPYFYNRIEAAKQLFEAGKVEVFVVSGDNTRDSYNEPKDMRDALVKSGVPDSIIYLDYAGLRTLDSVVRMNKIFGQASFIVVSQQFHNERAIYLAQQYGFSAYGYNAQDVSFGRNSFKTKIREKFARVKVFVDVILDEQPKFLGDPVQIK
ncbi:MAG: hypothetical protein RL662_1186 [Bacteroidota bacterium]|jgi:SanA protein